MEDHLAAFFADVELETVAGALVAFGELFADEDEMSHEVFVRLFQVFDARDGFAWNHQKVDRSFGVDVFDGDAFFIFKDKFGRDFLVDDFLKKSFFLSHGAGLKNYFLPSSKA